MGDSLIASCLKAPRAMIAAVLLVVASALGGCAGGGATTGSGSYAMAPSAGGGATMAFESIDGPPPQVFDRMVGDRAIAIENKGSHGSSCGVEEFWQQKGERGRTRRDLFGGPVHRLP